MLKIIIGNATLTCHESGQVINVALAKADWLHEGSIICPPCQLFCDDCSSKSNEEDPNEELLQTLDDVECKVQPRINSGLLGLLQNLGFDADAFS